MGSRPSPENALMDLEFCRGGVGTQRWPCPLQPGLGFSSMTWRHGPWMRNGEDTSFTGAKSLGLLVPMPGFNPANNRNAWPLSPLYSPRSSPPSKLQRTEWSGRDLTERPGVLGGQNGGGQKITPGLVPVHLLSELQGRGFPGTVRVPRERLVATR